jgi:hypothetical protein
MYANITMKSLCIIYANKKEVQEGIWVSSVGQAGRAEPLACGVYVHSEQLVLESN